MIKKNLKRVRDFVNNPLYCSEYTIEFIMYNKNEDSNRKRKNTVNIVINEGKKERVDVYKYVGILMDVEGNVKDEV